jgi:hypothetical protein
MQGLYVLTFEDLAVFGLSQVLIIGTVVQLRAKLNLLKGISRKQFVVYAFEVRNVKNRPRATGWVLKFLIIQIYISKTRPTTYTYVLYMRRLRGYKLYSTVLYCIG